MKHPNPIAILGFLLLALPTGARAQSSRDNRAHYDFTMLYQLAGIAEGFNVGVEAQYALNADERVGFFYTRARELDFQWLWSSYYKAVNRVYGFNYQRFFGNSFYAMAGVAAHRQSIERRGRSAFGSSNDPPSSESRYTRRDWGGVMGIGNQWQSQNFTIGCEWAGVYQPLVNAEVRGSKTVWDDDRNATVIDLNHSDSKKHAYPRVVQFKLGWAF